jgi:hypothetical protein
MLSTTFYFLHCALDKFPYLLWYMLLCYS